MGLHLLSMIMIQNSYEKSDVSVFGSTGFIGGNFYRLFSDECVQIERESRVPLTSNVLYFISTTDNFNIFEDPQKDIDTNLKVLIDTLQNCKDTGTIFNFISSWYVYGNTELPAHENSVCSPKGFYSITKKCAEDLLVSFCETFDIQYRILRLSNVYGIGDMNASKKKNALQFLTTKLINNEPVHLYDGGEFTRDYMHVNDTCHAINKVVRSGAVNEIYNIGSGTEYQFRDLIEIVKDYVGSTSTVELKPTPEIYKNLQVDNMHLDVGRLRALGFECSITIDEGIKDMCDKLRGAISVK